VIDDEFGFGIGLEVALNEPEITPGVLAKFVAAYQAGTFVPDATLFSFPGEEDDEE
jgi:hypothetical protein